MKKPYATTIAATPATPAAPKDLPKGLDNLTVLVIGPAGDTKTDLMESLKGIGIRVVTADARAVAEYVQNLVDNGVAK